MHASQVDRLFDLSYNLNTETHTRSRQMGYIIAFVLGIVVATVGFTGIAKIGDQAVDKVQVITKEAAK
jgi:hypothetical protein